MANHSFVFTMIEIMNRQPLTQKIFPLVLILLRSCGKRQEISTSTEKEQVTHEQGDYDFVITEKALFPEGTAFDLSTHMVYVGSIYKQKIIGVSSEGKVTDLITKERFESLSPLGMEMDPRTNTLWVCAAVAPIVKHPAGTKRQAAILAFNPTTNQRLKKYVLSNNEDALLNDITMDGKGNIYATETMGGKIFTIDSVTEQLVVFCDLKEYSFPNGIIYHHPQKCLFVATDEGIIRIELASKEVTLIKTENEINTSTIDGLAIYENYFLGHQSTKISRFYFNSEISKITDVEIFDSGNDFDSSTTGEIGNGYYYYIVNSQIKSGVNRKLKTIKPLDSLENVIIRRKRL